MQKNNLTDAPSDDKRQVVANYELNGYRYGSFWEGREYEHQSEIALFSEIFAKVQSNNAPYEAILDVGGAYGRLLPVYQKYYKQVVLVDYSVNELKEGAANTVTQPSIRYVAANGYFLPFPNNVFDTVFCVRVIHHIVDTPAFFSELYRVVKPGGSFILEFANKQHIAAFFKALFTGKLKEFFSPEAVHIEHRGYDSQGIQDDQISLIFAFSRKDIVEKAMRAGFAVTDQYSLSFFRHTMFKKFIPNSLLIAMEKLSQKLFQSFFMTPSIVIVGRKPASDERTNDLRYVCPICKGELQQNYCAHCKKQFQEKEGIADYREPRPDTVTY